MMPSGTHLHVGESGLHPSSQGRGMTAKGRALAGQATRLAGAVVCLRSLAGGANAKWARCLKLANAAVCTFKGASIILSRRVYCRGGERAHRENPAGRSPPVASRQPGASAIMTARQGRTPDCSGANTGAWSFVRWIFLAAWVLAARAATDEVSTRARSGRSEAEMGR